MCTKDSYPIYLKDEEMTTGNEWFKKKKQQKEREIQV